MVKNPGIPLINSGKSVLLIHDRIPITNVIVKHCEQNNCDFGITVSNSPENLLETVKKNPSVFIIVTDSHILNYHSPAVFNKAFEINWKVQFILLPNPKDIEIEEEIRKLPFIHLMGLSKAFGLPELLLTVKDIFARFVILDEILKEAFLKFKIGEIKIFSEKRRGRISYAQSKIIHAEIDNLTGTEALSLLFSLSIVSHSIGEILEDAEKENSLSKLIEPEQDSETKKKYEIPVQLKSLLVSVGQVNIENIDADSIVERFMELYPNGNDEFVRLKDVNYKNMPVSIRNYIKFHIHSKVLSFIQVGKIGDNFRNEQVYNSILTLISNYLNSFKLTSDDFRDMLLQAVLFKISLALNPVGTIANILRKKCGGQGDMIIVFLQCLRSLGFLEKYLLTVIGNLKKLHQEHLKHSEIIELLEQSKIDTEPDFMFHELLFVLRDMHEITGIPDNGEVNTIQMSTLSKMLKSRNLSHFSEVIESNIDSQKTGISVEFLERYWEVFKGEPQ